MKIRVQYVGNDPVTEESIFRREGEGLFSFYRLRDPFYTVLHSVHGDAAERDYLECGDWILADLDNLEEVGGEF